MACRVILRTDVRMSDLHSAAVHLDNLRSESLYGGQDLFLVLQRGDAETQHIPAETTESVTHKPNQTNAGFRIISTRHSLNGHASH